MPIYVNDKKIDRALAGIAQSLPVRSRPNTVARQILEGVALEFERRKAAKDKEAWKVVELFQKPKA